MKVLVSDNLGEVGIQMFKDAPGIEVDVKTVLREISFELAGNVAFDLLTKTLI